MASSPLVYPIFSVLHVSSRRPHCLSSNLTRYPSDPSISSKAKTSNGWSTPQSSLIFLRTSIIILTFTAKPRAQAIVHWAHHVTHDHIATRNSLDIAQCRASLEEFIGIYACWIHILESRSTCLWFGCWESWWSGIYTVLVSRRSSCRLSHCLWSYMKMRLHCIRHCLWLGCCIVRCRAKMDRVMSQSIKS